MYNLTLKQSSYLFLDSINLIKNKTISVSPDSLSSKEKTILNKYICSGGVHSDKGVFEVEVLEETVVSESEESKNTEETLEEVKEEVAVKEEENKEVVEEASKEAPKKAPARRTTSRKKQE